MCANLTHSYFQERSWTRSTHSFSHFSSSVSVFTLLVASLPYELCDYANFFLTHFFTCSISTFTLLSLLSFLHPPSPVVTISSSSPCSLTFKCMFLFPGIHFLFSSLSPYCLPPLCLPALAALTGAFPRHLEAVRVHGWHNVNSSVV